MDDKVKELVEWAADIIRKDYAENSCYSIAQHILSHPDLALIVRRGSSGFSNAKLQNHYVIPLAKELALTLKEVKDV